MRAPLPSPVTEVTTWFTPAECRVDVRPWSFRHQDNCIIAGNLLNSGDYRLRLLLVEDGSLVTFTDEAILLFGVEDLRKREIG